MDIKKKPKNRCRRFLSFLVALCLTAGLVPLMSITASASTGGTGTAEDPFLVNNESDLRMVGRGQVHTGGTWSLSAHYKLTENITLTGENNWTPIGTDAARFTGTFDGNGRLVDGLHINQLMTAEQGMFGVIGAGGTVRNLGLTNVDITGNSIIGGIAGRIVGGTISECFVTGTVNGASSVGGIAGRVDNASVSNCYSVATVYGGGIRAGGITGMVMNISTISYCYATGGVATNVSGDLAFTGGIVGSSQTHTGLVQNTVALNTYVVSVGSANLARIGSAVFRNNYALPTGIGENQINWRSRVSFVGNTPNLTSGNLWSTPTSSINGDNGSTLTANQQFTQAFWTTTANWNGGAWSTDIWKIEDGSLPTLAWEHFVDVTGITGIPATANAGTPLTLNGAVSPANAANQDIVWTVKDAGTTGATISGNTLNTTAGGTVIVTATIANGAAISTDYTQDFSISVIMRKAIVNDQTSANFSVNSDNLQYILDNHIVTNEDIANNNSVTLTLTVKETDDKADGAESIIELSQGRLLQFFDITIEKQINSYSPVQLTELPAPVEITIDLSEELSGRTGYTVYRYHNGVQRIGTNTETDEFFTVSRGSGIGGTDQVIIYTKNFSTFAVVQNIVTIDGAPNSDDFDVQARIVDLTAPVYRIDIEWGDMKFIYNITGSAGTWNPETQEYNNPVTAGWSGFEEGNNEIIVWNHSNADVNVSFAITDNDFNGAVVMNVNQVNDDTDVPAVNMTLGRVPTQSADAPNINVFLWIDGEPSADDIENLADVWQRVGIITVTITPDGDVLTPLR